MTSTDKIKVYDKIHDLLMQEMHRVDTELTDGELLDRIYELMFIHEAPTEPKE